MKPVLSICIPTYSRSKYLQEAIDSIWNQISESEELLDKVELVVADNDSPDNTEEVVKSYEHKFRHFTYFKNAENVGFDKNVDLVVRAATGQYCWYLGDDDLIVNGAVKHMLDICESNQYAVISMGSQEISDRNQIPTETQEFKDEDHITGLTPSDAYLKGHLPSALSMLAFDREKWLEAADFESYTPGWFYFETILKIATSPDSKILYIDRPIILTGQDMRWADGGAGLKIFIDCNTFLRKMIDWGYDRQAIEAELKSNERRFPWVLMQSKIRGLPTTKKELAMIKDYTRHASLPTRFFSPILFFIPNRLVTLARDVKKKV